MNLRSHVPGGATLVALGAAVLALLLIAPDAPGSGGLSAGGDSKAGGGATAPKYARIWERTSKRNKRWARNTAECESGGNPKAIGGGGRYRGAFQFLRAGFGRGAEPFSDIRSCFRAVPPDEEIDTGMHLRVQLVNRDAKPTGILVRVDERLLLCDLMKTFSRNTRILCDKKQPRSEQCYHKSDG